ncbi:DUF932 domain-containing protein [Streptacidiphilus anmyonensis]|uniref:DUF932 domain-containing protein n=1 Tax=Streptacidiphilus anmyonensis TaxID=405782 RepID=UPI000A51262B|nr:DUF932 domain-containing protein [Streptacidiphilus anmyonensis]
MQDQDQQLTGRAAVVTPGPDGSGTARNAELRDLVEALHHQHARKADMVVPAERMRAEGGNLLLTDNAHVLSTEGVTRTDQPLRPTSIADEGIAEKLGIPRAYLRKLREQLPSLYDANVNGWLGADPSRRLMLRTFTPGDGDGGIGVLRAVLSDSYRRIDNFDVLVSALAGIRESGHPIKITGCDLSDRRMVVRVESEDVRVMAPELLRGYRSPFNGQTGDQLPIVSAGFVLTNSEVGSGAYTVTPRVTVQVCTNGLTITKDAYRKTHLGERMDEGLIRISEDTDKKYLALIQAQTRDAVTTFLDREYVEAKLREIERQAGREVTDPAKSIEVISKKFRFSEAVQASVLNHFIRGGQPTAGGILQAITATAQTLQDADAAYELEAQALAAMALV